MIIDPQVAVSEGWITFETLTPDQVLKCLSTPNGVDFTLDRLFEVSKYAGGLSETEKVFKTLTQVEPRAIELPGLQQFSPSWTLTGGNVYDGMSNIFVRLPIGVVATLTVRSTMNRLGVQLSSGVYDQGFTGNIGFALTARAGDVVVAPGTRVGQILFWKAEGAKQYLGGYNHAAGTHWAGK